MQNTTCTDSKSCTKWLKLKDLSDASRLLYPSPVCFLTVVSEDHASPTHNVMVLSWLATVHDDDGLFVFSINRRRHTSTKLRKITEFCLSVPVQGMEELMLQVGSTSGRWGRSKFGQDYTDNVTPVDDIRNDHSNIDESTKNRPSKRAKKKKERFVAGIPGLRRTTLGQDRHDNETETSRSNVFAIDGTMAHLRCQIVCKEEDTFVIDDQHCLVLAQIQTAFVRTSHWNSDKRVFASSEKPYLTFFGSQSFGYVRPNSSATVPKSLPRDVKNLAWIALKEGKQFSRILYTNPLCIWKTISSKSCMAVTKLTATNNEGSFVCCLDQKLAHGMLLYDNHQEKLGFSLFVPTQGAEEKIMQTMLSKNVDVEQKQSSIQWETMPMVADDNDVTENLSKNKHTTFDCLSECVAVLQCQITSVFTRREVGVIPHNSVIVLAKMRAAFVHPSYWDGSKNRFQLQEGRTGPAPYYMKYLGNGSFGYVAIK